MQKDWPETTTPIFTASPHEVIVSPKYTALSDALKVSVLQATQIHNDL